MHNFKHINLDLEQEKISHSIENTITGDTFSTMILSVNKIDLKQISQKAGWNFNWKTEFDNQNKDLYKLTIAENTNIIQGLISLSIENGHVFVHLLESAPFNIGKNKIYSGVAGNLMAYACKLSLINGHKGYVGFTSKTILIEHYVKTLKATHIGEHRMIIFPKDANFLINKYFKNE